LGLANGVLDDDVMDTTYSKWDLSLHLLGHNPRFLPFDMVM
jgi:hypothetical protein